MRSSIITFSTVILCLILKRPSHERSQPETFLGEVVGMSPKVTKSTAKEKHTNRIYSALRKIHSYPIQGEFKRWIYNCYLVPSLRFLLTVEHISVIQTNSQNTMKKLFDGGCQCNGPEVSQILCITFFMNQMYSTSIHHAVGADGDDRRIFENNVAGNGVNWGGVLDESTIYRQDRGGSVRALLENFLNQSRGYRRHIERRI